MDLHKFEFPKVAAADMAFPTFDTIPALRDEAKARGFYKGGPYVDLTSALFFRGGKVTFLEGVPEDFQKAAWTYVRAFMGSFAPSHEDKTAICAMLLSEIVQPTLQSEAA
jgi:hypothetical protein